MPSYEQVIRDYLAGEDYTIVAGDTFSALADRWGMTTQDFADYDAGTGTPNRDRIASGDINRIQVGEVIKIPKVPATVAVAPAEITLPDDIKQTMQDFWEQSIALREKMLLLGPGDDFNYIKLDRISLEHGGTYSWLIADDRPIIDRTGPGTSGTFSPDTSRAAGRYITGDYHTHPFTRFTDGIHDVPNVSWSGGDLSVTTGFGIFFDMMQSHKTIFGVMRTAATPLDTDNNAEEVFDAEFDRVRGTDGSPDAFREAVRKAARHTCTQFNLAYYEGFDSNTLTKV